MEAGSPLLPADCRGLGSEDPLVRRWKAGSRQPDFAALFRQAADLVFDWILAARGAQGEWSRAASIAAHDLYGGLPGIAVFAAAHAAATGRPHGAELATELLDGLAGAAAHELPFSGAATGLGSLLYAQLAVARSLGRRDLVERSLDLAGRAAARPGEASGGFDVVGGRAGNILVLDRLIEAARQQRPAAVAGLERRLAEEVRELLGLSRSFPEGRAFVFGCEPPASGFAHGAAGAAAALALASRHLAIPSLHEILAEILAFERSLYHPEARNWLPSPAERTKNPLGWCRGAPGIALSRMLLLSERVGPRLAIREDLEAALRSTLALPVQPLDHLCCGNMSRAEILLFAHEQSGASPDLEAARWIGLYVLRAAKVRGSFALGSEDADDPFFFQGSAGIGYTFLRLALPGYFPSILAFK